jgi:hypothetical protein
MAMGSVCCKIMQLQELPYGDASRRFAAALVRFAQINSIAWLENRWKDCHGIDEQQSGK